MTKIIDIPKDQWKKWQEFCLNRDSTVHDMQLCPICGCASESVPGYGPECVCFAGCGHVIRMKCNPPSSEVDCPWVHARLPSEVSRQKISDAILWVLTLGEAYKASGKIHPRNIYDNDLVIPETEIDLFLQSIDYSLLDEFRTSDPSLFPYILCGKWLIFLPEAEIDATWATISTKIEAGTIQYGAKVSTKSQANGGDHVVCIYVYNYLDHQDVLDCREALRALGYSSRLFFKPDEFTSLHKYSNQQDSNDQQADEDDEFDISSRYPSPKINHRYYG